VHDVADDARAALDVALYEQQKGPSKQLAPPPMQVRSLIMGSFYISLVYMVLSKRMSDKREHYSTEFTRLVLCVLSARLMS